MKTETNEIASVRPTEGAITRWSPFDEFNDLFRRMEDLFSRNLGYTPLSRLIPGDAFVFEPTVDIFDKGDHVEMLAALPGFPADLIKVEATPDSIMIHGERKALHEEKGAPVRQRWASSAASFSMNYPMPAEIDPNAVKATLKDGILRVEVPKSEVAAFR
jgi:HSP20 family protein